MEFHRVIGKIDKDTIKKAEALLTKVFLDLAIRPTNGHIGSALGGDPLIFSLIQPMQHVATININTAATDGKRYFWNPVWVLKKSRIGLRLVCYHEGTHAFFMHPKRRGKRDPKLWNKSVDFIVNFNIMEWIRSRGLDPSVLFQKELGNFVTLEAYAEFLKDPYKKIQGWDDWDPEPLDPEFEASLPKPGEDRELTEQEKKTLEDQMRRKKYFFADPALPADMRRPEKIYDYLLSLMPKCPKCGSIGRYPAPTLGEPATGEAESKEEPDTEPEELNNEPEQKENEETTEDHEPDHEEEHPNHDHQHDHNDQCSDSSGASDDDSEGDGSSGPGTEPGADSGCSGHGGCDACGSGLDIFGFGDTLDDHMDSEEDPKTLAKRLADAIETAKRLGGSVPAGLEEELDALIAPKIIWQDHVRVKISKARNGNAKNDWTRFRTRPMFAGLMNPKKINIVCKFGILLDTSGSMSVQDMTRGVSQLQSLDSRSEGWIVPADSEIYWKDATKLRNVSPSAISQIKVVGRGGTKYAEFFRDYSKEMGKVDFLIVITDGFLAKEDINEMVSPGVDVIWLITSRSVFNAPFGKVFDLND